LTLSKGQVAGVLLACLAGSAMAEDAKPTSGSPLDRLRQRSADTRWNEIREKAASPAKPAYETPSPRTHVPALPPVTRTIFDDLDEPFAGESEDEIAEQSVPRSAALPEWKAAKPAAEAVPQPMRMRDFLSANEQAEDVPLIETQEIVPAQDSFIAPPRQPLLPSFEEPAPMAQPVAPAAPEYSPAPLQTAQAEPELKPGPEPMPALQPTPDPAPESQLDRAVSTGSGLKPLSEIQPYFDYSPDGADAYEFLCPPPGQSPGGKTYDCPPVEALADVGNLDRAFSGTNYMWTAANLYHNPLYFEDPNLERYGLSHRPILQPIMSMSRFTGQLVTLPYHVALSPPDQREYVLGWYRSQDICTPRKRNRIPWNAKAAMTAAGTYTGLIFLFP
jgi:hypothetical protein